MYESSGEYIGKPLLRKEDARHLTGTATFVADVELPGLAEVALLRSPYAHARIQSVNTESAAAMPGVIAVFSGADLAESLPPFLDDQVPPSERWKQQVPHKLNAPSPRVLAVDKVHYVGEPVAVVVAENRYLAEDALDAIVVEYQPLPVLSSPEQALAPGAPLIHEETGTNCLAWFKVQTGQVDEAFRQAPHVLKARLHYDRCAASPMECRGIAARFDRRNSHLTVWASTQVPHPLRMVVAQYVRLPEHRVRVIAPDIGGGFGPKGVLYNEDVLVPYLAVRLGRPVRWIEDRREHFVATAHARDQFHEAEVAFDGQGRILAVRDRIVVDCGAYNPTGIVPSYNTATHLLGPYRIPHYQVEAFAAATNKTPTAPYRGAGRPEAVFVMERLVDKVARHLGLDSAEVRFRNLIGPEAMPYHVGIPYRDGTPVIYDSGDYPECLRQALEAVGWNEIRQNQEAWRQTGRLVGAGLAMYVEGTGVGPHEGALVRVDPTGELVVYTGSAPQGQGHETAFAQVTSELWGTETSQVTVVTGDTDGIPHGLGTMGSRSAVVVSNAIREASLRLQAKIRQLVAARLEVHPDDVVFSGGRAHVKGMPGRGMTLAEVARAAAPGSELGRPAGIDPGLEATFYYEPVSVTWSYAAHAAAVEINRETGAVKILKYVVAHDAGRIINPMIADGQIRGGVAQGIGGALLEKLVYDTDGQLLTGTLMDYLIPTATDIPPIELRHLEVPSPLNPLGLKGLGEGGAIGPPGALANAVSDALGHLQVDIDQLPITPEALVRHLGSLGGTSTGTT